MTNNIVFDNIPVFSLKCPSTLVSRPDLSSYGEWIEIYKNKNELPTAKLRSWQMNHQSSSTTTWGFPHNYNTNQLIVLDFKHYGSGYYDKINNNISENGFYLILRITDTVEGILPNHEYTDNGTDISLNQRIYNCDIIGPTEMLDINIDYFLYEEGNSIKILGEERNKKFIEILDNKTENNYENLKVAIITGLSGEVVGSNERTDTDYISTKFNNQEYNQTSQSQFVGISRAVEVCKLCNSSNALNEYLIGQVDILYNLPDILWCSLRSPRKLKIRKKGIGTKKEYRFIDNFIDLDTNINENYCNGGGYARYSNTIDLGRKLSKPYYYNTSSNNINTDILFNNYTSYNYGNTPQYYAENKVVTFNDISNNCFRVYYKLLIPCDISMTYFLGDISNSNITFLREVNMNGSTTPIGTTNEYANRDSEQITLEWKDNNIDKKSIVFFDVASGSSNLKTNIQFADAHFNTYNSNDSVVSNFDIDSNVINFKYTLPNNGLDGVETGIYSSKNTDGFELINQIRYFNINIVPDNYQIFRYINRNISQIFFNTDLVNINSPLKITNSETCTYQFFAIYNNNLLRDNAYIFRNADIFISKTQLPTSLTFSPSSVNTIFYDQDSSLFLTDIDSQDINIFLQNSSLTFNNISIVNKINIYNYIYFSLPYYLQYNNHISLSDYWKLSNNLNNFILNPGTMSYFTNYLNQSMNALSFEIKKVSVSIKENIITNENLKYILVNSNKNKSQSVGISNLGSIFTNNISCIIGGFNFIIEPIETRPVILEILCDDTEHNNIIYNPFGITSQRRKYIGNRGNIDINAGINKNNFNLNNVLADYFKQENSPLAPNSTEYQVYNNTYNLSISCWNEPIPVGQTSQIQNPSFNNSIINRGDKYKLLLVNLPDIIEIKPEDLTSRLNSNNSQYTIEWVGFEFNKYDVWGSTGINATGLKGEIVWNIIRRRVTDNTSQQIYNGISNNINLKYIPYDTTYINGRFVFIDNTVKIYDKYQYTVSGTFRWTGIKDIDSTASIPILPITGFTTDTVFICKNNRFPYGRFNTTSTNLKLYRPLLLSSVGQFDKYGRKIGGTCSAETNLSTKAGTNNNIYNNTADQMTKKEIYKRLSILRLNR